MADAAPYKDVPTNHTFAGYIAYCQKEGIISGYADGTFKPAATLTGYAFMKMLLGALGYDSAIEGYTGANWSIAVAKQAINAGLNKSLKGSFNGVKAVTREEACLYAFNTLKATMVEYDKNSTVIVGNITIKDTSDAKSKRWGSSAINDGNIDGKKGGDGYVQFAEEYFNKLVKSETTDDMGRPATKWTNKGDKIGTYADKANQTYYKNVKLGNIYSDLGMTQKDEHATVIVNGVEATDVVVSKNNDRKISSSSANDGLVGDGSIVEVYYDEDDNHVTIVVADVYVGEITSKETKAADPYVVVDSKLQMKKVDGTNYTGYTGNATHFECDTSAFAEDDIVLFTYSQAEKSIQTVVKAESTEGIVSEYTLTKSLTLADKEYKYAKNIVFDFGAENTMRTKNTYTIYTDANGLVIFVTESEFKPTDYAFVLDAEASSQTGFKFDRAKLVLADGSVKTVYTDDNYADCKGYIVTYRANGDNEYVLRKAPNTTFNGGTIDASMFNADANIPIQGVLTGGKTPVRTNASTSDFFMQNGNAKVYPGNGATLYANSETVFVVAESDRTGTTYTSYTGIKNAPSIDPKNSAKAEMVYYVRGNNLLGFVFVDATGCDVVNGRNDITFLAGKEGMSKLKTDSDNNSYYMYNAVVDGKITTVKVSYDATTLDAGVETNRVYQNVKYNNKGTIATGGADVTGYDVVENNTTGIWKLSGEYTIGLNSTTTAAASTRYTVASDAKMYLVDTDGVITKVDDVKNFKSDATAKVIALLDKADGDIAYLFVQETDNGKKEDAGTAATPVTSLVLDKDGSKLNATVTGTTAGKEYEVKVSMIVSGVEKAIGTYEFTGVDGTTTVTLPIAWGRGVTYTATCGDQFATYTA